MARETLESLMEKDVFQLARLIAVNDFGGEPVSSYGQYRLGVHVGVVHGYYSLTNWPDVPTEKAAMAEEILAVQSLKP